MTIDWTKPIQTRKGYPARFLGTVQSDEGLTHAVAIKFPWRESEYVETVTIGGAFDPTYYAEHECDIINALPEPKYIWLNVYEWPDGDVTADEWNKRNEADVYADSDPAIKRIARIKLNINEIRGRFDA